MIGFIQPNLLEDESRKAKACEFSILVDCPGGPTNTLNIVKDENKDERAHDMYQKLRHIIILLHMLLSLIFFCQKHVEGKTRGMHTIKNSKKCRALNLKKALITSLHCVASDENCRSEAKRTQQLIDSGFHQ